MGSSQGILQNQHLRTERKLVLHVPTKLSLFLLTFY